MIGKQTKTIAGIKISKPKKHITHHTTLVNIQARGDQTSEHNCKVMLIKEKYDFVAGELAKKGYRLYMSDVAMQAIEEKIIEIEKELTDNGSQS